MALFSIFFSYLFALHIMFMFEVDSMLLNFLKNVFLWLLITLSFGGPQFIKSFHNLGH